MQPTILLVNPPIYDFAAYDLFNKPLSLLYIASILRGLGFNIRLIDALDRYTPQMVARFGMPNSKLNGTGKYHCHIIPKPTPLQGIPRYYRCYGMPADILAEALEDEYNDHRPVAVLVSSMMTYWYPGVRDTIALIRQRIPSVPVALGGVYARLMPRHAKSICKPDVLLDQPSLEPTVTWLSQIADKHISQTELAFTQWPGPAYDLYQHLTYITLLTSLGCPFRCQYCASGILQPTLQQLQPDRFLSHLQSILPLLPQGKGPVNIALMDDALLANRQSHIVPILERISRLQLPLSFHCPNGLHVRFIDEPTAELMFANNFETIRLSYEGKGTDSKSQQSSDQKVTDKQFLNALNSLESGGYKRANLEAYILVGLPRQSLGEIQRSGQFVHDQGLQVRLCQYSPIPKTPLFELTCQKYHINPDEPLLHNNTITPARDKTLTDDQLRQFKQQIITWNNSIKPT